MHKDGRGFDTTLLELSPWITEHVFGHIYSFIFRVRAHLVTLFLQDALQRQCG